MFVAWFALIREKVHALRVKEWNPHPKTNNGILLLHMFYHDLILKTYHVEVNQAFLAWFFGLLKETFDD